jgi:hypothetical protein
MTEQQLQNMIAIASKHSVGALSVASQAKRRPVSAKQRPTSPSRSSRCLHSRFHYRNQPARSISARHRSDLRRPGRLGGHNTGGTVINGNVGVSPGTSITGFFPPGIVTLPGVIHNNGPGSNRSRDRFQ